MPTYDFRCQDCKKTFSVVLTWEQFDKGKPKCPKCGKKKEVEPVFGSVLAKTSKKS